MVCRLLGYVYKFVRGDTSRYLYDVPRQLETISKFSDSTVYWSQPKIKKVRSENLSTHYSADFRIDVFTSRESHSPNPLRDMKSVSNILQEVPIMELHTKKINTKET
jgi:hypothetical protein